MASTMKKSLILMSRQWSSSPLRDSHIDHFLLETSYQLTMSWSLRLLMSLPLQMQSWPVRPLGDGRELHL
jgi:hypothetical protein